MSMIEKAENNKECTNHCTDKNFKNCVLLPQKYSGQIYKSRKIILNPPKKDIISSVTNINRDICVKEIEVLENGVNVNVDLTISLNYGTSNNILIKNENPKENNQDIVISEQDKNEIILTDGPVRNTTIVIPYNIYISIPKQKMCSNYRVVNECLKVSNTEYILDDESVVCGGIPIGSSLKGIMESYIISVELEVI